MHKRTTNKNKIKYSKCMTEAFIFYCSRQQHYDIETLYILLIECEEVIFNSVGAIFIRR